MEGVQNFSKSHRLDLRSLCRRQLERRHRAGKTQRGLIMTTGYGTASFAIKAGYIFLAAIVVVFIAMLVLTVLHP
jgi:hypothetical protein